MCSKFAINNLHQSRDIAQNTDGSISHIRISGQYFINRNCQNYRTSHDIAIKLGTVIKLDKENMPTVAACHFFNLWPICSHPEAGFRTHDL